MRADQYSKSASMDVRDACALALSRVIKCIDRQIAGERVKFNHVFDEWADFEDKVDPPTACVLPPPEWTYDDTGQVRLLESDTIETLAGTVPAGEPPSFGLYKTAEMLDRFTLAIRCGSTAQRSLYKLAVEEVFQTRHLTMDPDGEKYGLKLPLPEYWGVTARVSLLAGANTDNEDLAARNQREASFTISMQAPKVQLGAVWPMDFTITEQTQTGDGRTISTQTAHFANGARS